MKRPASMSVYSGLRRSTWSTTCEEMCLPAGRRVLFLIPKLDMGGAERVVLHLASEAQRSGAEVAIGAAHGALVDDIPEGVRFVDLGDGRSVRAQLRKLRRLIALMRVLAPTAINSHHFPLAVHAWTAMKLCRRPAPILLTIHGPERRIYEVPIGILGPLFASKIYTVSRDVRDRLRRFSLPWGAVIETVHIGCPEAPNTRDSKARPVVAAIGRLVDVKGHRYLIEAWRLLRERGVSEGWMLEFWGEGPRRTDLERLARNAGLQQSVVFRGVVKDAGTRMQELAIVVLPSLSEALPLSLIEAMAAGRPIVASDVAGVREVVGGDAVALLVPPRDPLSLADALQALLLDVVRRREMGAAGRRRHAQAFRLESFNCAYAVALGLR